LEKQRAPEAVALLTDLTRQVPADQRDAEVQLLLGSALLRSGKAADAVATLRRYLQGSPNSPRALALLAQALAESGQLPAGIELLERAEENAEILDTLGRLYQRRQPPDLAPAQAVLARAAALQPQSLRVCVNYATVLQHAQQANKALAEIIRCTAPLLAPPPESPAVGAPLLDGVEEPQRALTLRAELEVKAGRYDDAMATLRAALQMVPAGSALAGVLRGRLAQALMRRGLALLPATVGPAAAPLADLTEAHKLQGSAATGHALALGLLSTGKPAEALQIVSPLVDANPNDPRLLGVYGRALRENGQLVESRQTLQKAEAMVTAAGAAPAGANVALRAALRQELALTLMALKKPVEALRLLDGNDEITQRLRAQANLVSARALFDNANPTPAGPPGPSGALPQPLGHAVPDIHAVMFVTQAALKAGPAVLPVQRAEAKLWQVRVLHGTGQDELAARLLGEVSVAFDQPTLDSLLGPGGFASLQAQIVLRGGDFQKGVMLAQHAISRLPKDAARPLQTALAFAYTERGVELASRGEYDRANSLLRSALIHTQGGPLPNLLRAQYNLAVLQLMRLRPEDARVVLGKLDPQLLPEALIGLGSYYDAMGDPRAALDAYRRYGQLLEQNPTVPRPPYADLVEHWVETLSRVYDATAPSSPPATAAPRTSGRALRPLHRPAAPAGRGAP
jgi:tetratricopeptide (TPR) repeat protein